MNTQHLCPFCTSPLLCQISGGNLQWYCRHCHLDIPYGVGNELAMEMAKHQSYDTSDSQTTTVKAILRHTVQQIKKSLNVDRVMIWKYLHNQELIVVEEALEPEYSSMREWKVGHCFETAEITQFEKGNSQIKDYSYPASLNSHSLAQFFQVKTRLSLPIRIKDSRGVPKLWGLIILDQCCYCRQWRQSEINMTSLVADHLSVAIEQLDRYQQLSLNYQRLQDMTCLSNSTGLRKYCQLDAYLHKQWLKMEKIKHPLSVILLKLDDWSRYKYVFGETATQSCLEKVTTLIEVTLSSQDYASFKNQEDAITIILLRLDEAQTVKLAEQLRLGVKNLRTEAGRTSPGNYLTASVGSASLIPETQQKPLTLIAEAEKALEAAMEAGGDRTVFHRCLDHLSASSSNIVYS